MYLKSIAKHFTSLNTNIDTKNKKINQLQENALGEIIQYTKQSLALLNKD